MEKEKPRSFRLSSDPIFKETGFGNVTKKDWWRFRRMTKNEYRNTAGLCIGLGAFLIPVLLPVGIIAGIVWIYLIVKEKISKHESNY